MYYLAFAQSVYFSYQDTNIFKILLRFRIHDYVHSFAYLNLNNKQVYRIPLKSCLNLLLLERRIWIARYG